MSPLKKRESHVYSEQSDSQLTASSKIKRSEFTKSIKNGNFSPIRHVGNSNNRLSFMSQSPTRYDEIYSNSKSTPHKNQISPFEQIAHSEDLDDLKPCIKKQVSSDNKTIKIAKLIHFHREIEEQRTSDVLFGTQSATKAEFQFCRGDSSVIEIQSKFGKFTEEKPPTVK
jgi:hypothetical protein